MIYDQRFKLCRDCAKVNLLRALFYPLLPDSCGYVERFRKTRKIRYFFRWLYLDF